MLRQNLWLRFCHLRKAIGQRLCNAPVMVLTGALEQRVVSGLLDQSMLESIVPMRSRVSINDQTGLQEGSQVVRAMLASKLLRPPS